jgi:hypothetical protein
MNPRRTDPMIPCQGYMDKGSGIWRPRRCARSLQKLDFGCLANNDGVGFGLDFHRSRPLFVGFQPKTELEPQEKAKNPPHTLSHLYQLSRPVTTTTDVSFVRSDFFNCSRRKTGCPDNCERANERPNSHSPLSLPSWRRETVATAVTTIITC